MAPGGRAATTRRSRQAPARRRPQPARPRPHPPSQRPVLDERPARARAAVAVALLPALVLLAGAVLIGLGTVAAGAALLVLGALVAAASVVLSSTGRLLARLATRPLDPDADARLVNLAEGLCVANGLPLPRLVVLDDVAPNALLLGWSPGRAVLVVTSGLLVSLDRMELEGVLAHELTHAKRGDLLVASAARSGLCLLVLISAAGPRLLLRLSGADHEALADRGGAGMTRYPPGLRSALVKLAAAPTTRPALPAGVARLTAPFWCAPLDEARPRRPYAGALELDERIAMLAEL